MWEILRNYGVPEKIVNFVKCLYDGYCTSVVHLDGILSKEFLGTTRVLKGDTLAPFLFIVVLNFVCTAEGSNNNRLTYPPSRIIT